VFVLLPPFGVVRCEAALNDAENDTSLTIRSTKLGRELKLDGMFYETSAGRVKLPRELTATNTSRFLRSAKMEDGRVVTLSMRPNGANHFNIRLSEQPDSDIVKWGVAGDAASDEYYTGLMERYLSEFDFRYDSRDTSDGERARLAIEGTKASG